MSVRPYGQDQTQKRRTFQSNSSRNEVKWNLTQLRTLSAFTCRSAVRAVARARSALLASALCATFSWRLLPSFSLLIIHDHLPSDSCRSAVGQVFSFFVVLAYAWLLFDPCFLVILADNLGGTLDSAMAVAFVCVFLLLLYSVVWNTYNILAAFLFARRTDCGFAFTPTAGTQLSLGPRCDFDLHLYMSFLLPVVTQWSHGLGLGNCVSVAWFLCDSSIWFHLVYFWVSVVGYRPPYPLRLPFTLPSF